MKNKISNPHDKMFKEVWSKKENAVDFLKNYLPKDILNIVDIDSLSISKDSFIDKKLKEFYSDILYQVDIAGKKGYIYFLFEHKSYPEYFIHLQLMEYMVKIWRQEIKNNSKIKKLPIIIPMVLYHGKSSWKTGKSFDFIFDFGHETKDLKKFLPIFEYILFDLTTWSDDDIMGTIYMQAVLLLFKYVLRPNLTHKLPRLLNLFDELTSKETGLQYIESLIRYLMYTAETFSSEDINHMLSDTSNTKAKEAIMTVAEELIHQGMERGKQEGLQEGLQKGKLEGKQEGLQEGLQKGLQKGLMKLQKAIKLSLYLKFGKNEKTEELISIVSNIDDIDMLDMIQEKILTIDSHDEFKTFVCDLLE